MKGSYVLKLFRQKTQNIAEHGFVLYSKYKRFFTIYAVASVLLVVFGGIFLLPQPADANILSDALTAPFRWFGDAIGDIGEGIVNYVVGFITSTIAAMVTGFAALVSFVLHGITWIAKTIAEFTLNLTLTANYTDITEAGPIQAGWPIFRDLANMGLILVLVAIGVGTLLNLQQGKLRSRLGIFFAAALLINFTPLISGLIIDISNIASRIFFDSAKQVLNAFVAGLPFQDTLHDIGQAFTVLGKALIGDGLGILDLLRIIITSVATIIFQLMLIFAFLLLSVLFLGRTLALWLLVIISPIAFLAWILPNTKKFFSKWWSTFLQWSFIIVPLVLSLWIAGIFVNNNQWCSAEEGTQIITNNAGVYDEDGNPVDEEKGLVGPGYGPVIADVANQEDICDMTTMLLAMGALGAGIVMSLSSSAQGANFITSRAKTYYTKAVKAAGRRVEKGVYRAPSKGKRGAKEAVGLGASLLGTYKPDIIEKARRRAQQVREKAQSVQEKTSELHEKIPGPVRKGLSAAGWAPKKAAEFSTRTAKEQLYGRAAAFVEARKQKLDENWPQSKPASKAGVPYDKMRIEGKIELINKVPLDHAAKIFDTLVKKNRKDLKQAILDGDISEELLNRLEQAARNNLWFEGVWKQYVSKVAEKDIEEIEKEESKKKKEKGSTAAALKGASAEALREALREVEGEEENKKEGE